MDEIDAGQARDISKLGNENTFQWLAICLIAIGFSLYINFVLISMLKSQSLTINKLIDQCGMVK